MDKLNHDTIKEIYSLNDRDLEYLLSDATQYLELKGIQVHLVNMEPVIETDVYRISREIAAEDKHHETCISDGKNIWLHDDLEDAGGYVGRLYDILHVGFGHLWQWSANGDSNYFYWGDKAWEMGTKSFLFANEPDIEQVWIYEEEASRIAYCNLRKLLSTENYSESFKLNYLRFFNDYCTTDLHYITDYYRTGKVVDFYKNWLFDSAELKGISLDFELNIKERTNKCVSLLKN